MHFSPRISIAVIFWLSLCGCEDQQARDALAQLKSDLASRETTIRRVEQDINDLRQRVDQSRERIDTLAAQLESVRRERATTQADAESFRMNVMKLFQLQMAPRRAQVDPTVRAFNFVESPAGRFAISCVAADTYLDGHKLILAIGNPFAATFQGFTLKTRFGKRAPAKGAADVTSHVEWEKSLRSNETPFAETLLPGKWTKVELVLSPSKPEEIAYLDFEMITSQLAFSGSVEK